MSHADHFTPFDLPPNNLDADLHALAESIQPSPAFVARLQAELAREQAAQPVRRPRLSWFRLPALPLNQPIFAQAALVILLLVLVFVAWRLLPGLGSQPAVQPTLSTPTATFPAPTPTSQPTPSAPTPDLSPTPSPVVAVDSLDPNCQWQTQDAARPMPILTGPGLYQGYRLYVQTDYGFTFKVPPDWTVQESALVCPDRSWGQHFVRLSPPAQPDLFLQVGFRRPDEPIRITSASVAAGEMQSMPPLPFFNQSITPQRLVYQGKDKALSYALDVPVAENLIVSVSLHDASSDYASAVLPPDLQTVADAVVQSFAFLSASPEVLAQMDINLSSASSPDGLWQIEKLAAEPTAASSIPGYRYDRITLARRDGAQRVVVLEAWSPDEPGAPRRAHFLWSASAARLYFYSESQPADCLLFPRQRGLLQVDLDSGQVRPVLPGDTGALALSPDLSRLAYFASDFDRSPAVVVRDLAANQEQVIPVDSPTIPDWQAGGLLWSPDGSRLVFSFAGPACASTGKPRYQILLVDPAAGPAGPAGPAGASRVIAGPERSFVPLRWEPDGRLRVADANGNPRALDVDTGQMTTLAAEASGPNYLNEAQTQLNAYFSNLAPPWEEISFYRAAAEKYDGRWDELVTLNPDVDLRGQDPANLNPATLDLAAKAELFERACHKNGFNCLRIRQIVSREALSDTQFRFRLQFARSDGALFNLNGQDTFDYTVRRVPETGEYKVMELPPH